MTAFLSQNEVFRRLRKSVAQRLIRSGKLKPVQRTKGLHLFDIADVERAAELIRKGGAL